MGKSASRFPFITLLMSHGVASVATAKLEERTYIFKLKGPVETGKAAIYPDARYDPYNGFETTSYVYTYAVYSFEGLNPSIYKPKDVRLPSDPSLSNGWTYLGDVSVPSVEYFPYFVRLLVCPKTSKLEEPLPLKRGIHIFQNSTLASGTKLAKGSVLVSDSVFQNEELTENFDVKEPMILLAGSTVAKDSKILQYSADAVSMFRDDDGTEMRMKTQEPHVIPISQGPLDKDYVLEAKSKLLKGSKVSLKLPRPQKRSPLTKKTTIARPLEIAAGSIITKDSVVATGSSISNRLRVVNLIKGTHWHVVDDLIFSDASNLSPVQNYVLFSSPKGSRWDMVNNDSKQPKTYVLEYAVPKYTPQEQAALLNTMGAPQNIDDKGLAENTLKKIDQLDKTTTTVDRQDVFTDDISHSLIHFSCPQYDCHNWYTEFATESARKKILDTFNKEMQNHFIKTLESLSTSPEFNQQRGAVFHAFISDAILGGFTLISPARLISPEKIKRHFPKYVNQPPLPTVELPPPIDEAHVLLRNGQSMRKILLPDISQIPWGKLIDFEAKWNILFSSPMFPQNVWVDPLDVQGNFLKVANPNTHREDFAQNQEQTPNKSSAKCFTFYLKPIGGNNVGFDSILLFFKVHEEQGERKVDDISVMFIQSTLANKHKITESGANLMYLWLLLLSTVYRVSQQHIHPFIFMVKQPQLKDFDLEGPNNSESFIPPWNVWVMDGHARQSSEVNLTPTDQLLLSSVSTVQPNTNPNHFRCYFCKHILTEFFPSHRCREISTAQSARVTKSENPIQTQSFFQQPPPGIMAPPRNIRQLTRENRLARFVFNLMWTRPVDPNTGTAFQQRAILGIGLTYPFPNAYTPESHEGLSAFDMTDVEMVRIAGQTLPRLTFHPTRHEQAQRVVWKVLYTYPIPTVFTYFPRRLDVTPTHRQNSREREDVAFRDVRNSHLVDMWLGNGLIGFGGDRTNPVYPVLSLRANLTPHDLPDCLWESQAVPLAQFHLPMDFYPKRSLLLGSRQILTPFEIKGILTLINPKDPKRKNLEASNSMIESCINQGQPLTNDDAMLVLSDDRMFSLLSASELESLQNRLQSLKSLSPYDLQSLVSFVSGPTTLIYDILIKIENHLPNHENTPTVPIKPWKFDAMEKCLQMSLSVSSEILKDFFEHKLLGKETGLSVDDVNLVMDGLETNPLLPYWFRRHVIPFFTKVPQGQQHREILLTKLETTYELREREIWSTILLIHAPIDKDEKTHLTSLIDTHPQLKAYKEVLTSLINDNPHTQDDIDKWKETLTYLEEEDELNGSPLDFLKLFTSKSEEVSKDARALEEAIQSAENILSRDRDTLLSLVLRKPRFTSSRRKEIATLCCRISSEWEKSTYESIAQLRLGKEYAEIINDCVANSKSLNDEHIKSVKELIDSNELLNKYSQEQQDILKGLSADLQVLLDRNAKLYETDQSLACSCALLASDGTKEHLITLFQYLRGNRMDLDPSLVATLTNEVIRFRSCLYLKLMFLFIRLDESKLSWKDLATLLCLPRSESTKQTQPAYRIESYKYHGEEYHIYEAS
ncbi:hypothetical protein BLNAU_18172 [Blattamonas nauphoetae]|uniref:Uncharacterized protein n=1 Tax=Blattamonas nauphoetae TaxID=2049346 RepID=A0ABQ9X5J7_9EUKA|nr:hypothetical protein BLNAU_18172 [Blattamonas nauphoetae]